MFYTIYKITNTLNGKIYVGKHQTERLDDGYYGSGKLIKAAIKKYGKEVFSKEILHFFSSTEEMDAKEKEIITEDFVNRSDTYNVGVGGEGGPHFKGKHHTEETKQRIRDNASKTITDEHKEKIRLSNTLTNTSRGSKVSKALKGKPKSEEHKQKIRESLLRKRQLSSAVVATDS